MSELIRVAIIGAGGFAREVLDVFDAVNSVGPRYDVVGFVVDPEYGKPGDLINEKPILGGLDWLEANDNVPVICAVGSSELRFNLIRRAKEAGAEFCKVIHPSAIMSKWVTVGEGTVITAGCILTNQIIIGDHVHMNLDCSIGHDAVLSSYVTLAPGVHVSGNVHIEEGCYVGTGANILEKKRIGAWTIVGAGSTVTRDAPPNATVVGVPAKVIKTRAEGWHLE